MSPDCPDLFHIQLTKHHSTRKYTSFPLSRKEGFPEGVVINWGGNHKKNLKLSLESSLRKLRTDNIDLLYVHWWDHSTSIPELMQSLNEVVRSGKVLYLGIPDTPGKLYFRQSGHTLIENSLGGLASE